MTDFQLQPIEDEVDDIDQPVPVVPTSFPAVEDPDDGDDDEGDDDGDRKSTRRRSAGRLTAPQVRRVLARYEALNAAPTAQRELLAAALDSRPDAEELTVNSLTAARGSLAAVTELITLAETDSPFEAVVHAMTLERPLARRVWQLLTVLGVADGTLPAKDAAAGAKLAEAATKLSTADRDTLAGLRELV